MSSFRVLFIFGYDCPNGGCGGGGGSTTMDKVAQGPQLMMNGLSVEQDM
jgi:hypothetical protein